MNDTKRELLDILDEIDKISKRFKMDYWLSYGSLLGAVREKGMIAWDEEIDIWIKQSDYDFFVEKLKTSLPQNMKILTNETKKYDLFFPRIVYKGRNYHYNHVDIFPLVGVPESNKKVIKFVDKCYFYNKIYYVKKQNPYKLYLENKRFIRFFQSIFLKVILLPIRVNFISKILTKLFYKYDIKNASRFYTFGGSYKMREVFDSNLFDETIRVEFESVFSPIPKKYDEILKQVYGDYMTPRKENYLS